MKSRKIGSNVARCAVLGSLVFFSFLGSNHKVSAASALSQAEAEKLTSIIYINGCPGAQPQLTRTLRLGTPDPNGHIREKYGPVMVYPVMLTFSGSCTGHPMGRTDYFNGIAAKYTASYCRNEFGEWSHTPFVGSCNWSRTAYQMDGQPKAQVPAGEAAGFCSLAEVSKP